MSCSAWTPLARLSRPSAQLRTRRRACRLSGEEAAQRVMAAWAAADLWPDAPAALRDMHAAGVRLAVLTNGSGETGQPSLTHISSCHGADPGAAWYALPPVSQRTPCCSWQERLNTARFSEQQHTCFPDTCANLGGEHRVLEGASVASVAPRSSWRRAAATPPAFSPAPVAADGIAHSVLQKAGIEGIFDALLDSNMAQAWKPARESYAFACVRLGLRPDQVGGGRARPPAGLSAVCCLPCTRRCAVMRRDALKRTVRYSGVRGRACLGFRAGCAG